MLKRTALYLIALAAMGAVLATAIPDADAARKTSLANSRLILDKDDVFLFPQLAAADDNAQLISFDYGTSPTSGSGVGIFGDDSMAFGIAAFRGDVVDTNLGATRYFPHPFSDRSLAGPSTPLDPSFPANPDTNTVVDLFGGMDLGAGILGARLSVGTGGTRAVTPEDDEQSLAHTLGALTLGYTMDQEGGLRLDTSLTTRFSSGSQSDTSIEEEELVTQTTANSMMVALSARGYMPMAEGLETGFLADIGYGSESATNLPDDPDNDLHVTGARSQLSLLGGAGPVYRVDDTTIAAYGVLGHYRQTVDGDVDEDNDATFSRNTVFPGIHMAADISLLDWLYFRSGLQYTYNYQVDGDEEDASEDGIERDDSFTASRASSFGWRTGLGLEFGAFTFDAVFQNGLITGGPDFIGGTGPGTFTMVSAGYQF